ncbi:MAG: amidohydrolase [Flavobacteriales bacterium]
MKKELNIALVQSNLAWENPEGNFAIFNAHLEKINNADLIVLPEMFSTGFSMEPQRLAESMQDKTMQWLTQKAKEKNCVITGSFIAEEKGKYYNRLIWMRADGSFESYDKRHLFRMAGENNQYSEGKKRLIVELKGWKICPLICYDLRFPVWSRNVKQEYDILLYIANWPAVRSHPWKSLLLARAIENQCYVLGLNRVGTDGKNLDYSGDSSIIDPLGKYVAEAVPGKEEIVTVTLNDELLEQCRKVFPVYMDGDTFQLDV